MASQQHTPSTTVYPSTTSTERRRADDNLAPDAIVNYLRDMTRDLVREEIARAITAGIQAARGPAVDAPAIATPPPVKAPRTLRAVTAEETPRRGRKPNLNDPRIPNVGSVLVREYGGKKISVQVAQDGFVYNGKTWPSLSAIATDATGLRTSGFSFFGLKGRVRGRRS